MLQEKLAARAAELRAHVKALAPALAGSMVLALLEDEAAALEALANEAGTLGEPAGPAAPDRPKPRRRAGANVLSFTRETLEALALPPPGKRATYHDARQDGLILRISAAGSKVFYAYGRVRHGEPERVRIGPFPAIEVDEARRQAARIRADLVSGVSTAERLRAARAEMTFANLFAEYWTRESKPNKRTWREDEVKFRLHLAGPIGRKKLTRITRADVAAIHSDLTHTRSPATANRVLSLVSRVFNWAKSAGLCDANPAERLPKNRETSRARFLLPAELPHFFRALSELPHETARDFFALAILTGARRENVMQARWEQIDFDAATWTIPRTKGDRTGQVVALLPEALALLRSREPKAAGWVFPGHRSRKDPQVIGHFQEPRHAWRYLLRLASWHRLADAVGSAVGWSEAERQAGEKGARENLAVAEASLHEAAARIGLKPEDFSMRDLKIHDLRRSLASWQARAGASLLLIGGALGHKNQSTTAIYARLQQDHIREGMAAGVNLMLATAGVKAGAEVLPFKRPANAK